MERLLASVASCSQRFMTCVNRARGGTKKRLVLLLALTTGAGGAFATPILHVHAATTTTNVAYIFDFGTGSNDPSGPGSGSSIFVNALTGTAPLGTYTTGGTPKVVTITDIAVSAIDLGGEAVIDGFSTAILYEVCDIGSASHAGTMAALNSYITKGHKLLIYDGDRCYPGGSGSPNYSGFLYPFTTSNPGPQGAGSCYSTVLTSTLTTGLAGYCDSSQIGGNDALGDANTFVSFNGAWCSSMTTKNANNNLGLVQAYARTPNGGLVVYSGEDNWFTFGPRSHQRLVFDNEIKQDWAPDGLPCALPASGIALTPASQTKIAPGSATLTAKVTDLAGNGQTGILVTFRITSGPNMAAHTGADMGTTTASGETTVTYSSVLTGTDVWEASFKDSLGNIHTSNQARVIWILPPDQQITAAGVDSSATEGQPSGLQTVAKFCDPDPLSTAAEYGATIDWGDGHSSPPQPVTIDATGPSACGNTFEVRGDNTYAEEGNYTVTTTITDTDNASNTATVGSTATVADAALRAACAAAPFSTQNFSGPTATFVDQDPNGVNTDYTATIFWGDASSSPGTVTGGPGSGPYTVSGTHNYSSTGVFTITTTIRDHPASATATCPDVVVAAFPTANGGTFVVGDLEATGPLASLTWWSSQWAKINLMSGGPAPSSMKGFAGFEDMALPVPLPPLNELCGKHWTTDPGNSTPPPPSVPPYMLVIVSSHITQTGSVIEGDIHQLIIVKNDPGYAPDPGHPGTGNEVILVCTAP
jgi:hypothetical protein